MRKRNFLLSMCVVVVGLGAFGSTKLRTNLVQGLQDFFAPIVNDTGSLPVNTVPAGTIVYQSAGVAPGFYGLASDGITWVSMGATSGITHTSWAGYHSSDCAFPYTSTSLSDPGADSTCTFQERLNTGFGTVSSYNDGTSGHNLPGIVFTPTKIGNYFVCAVTTFGVGTDGTSNPVVLNDISSTVVAASNPTNAANTSSVYYPLTLCGIYKNTSLTPTTLRIQAAVASNESDIIGGTGGTVNWSIYQID